MSMKGFLFLLIFFFAISELWGQENCGQKHDELRAELVSKFHFYGTLEDSFYYYNVKVLEEFQTLSKTCQSQPDMMVLKGDLYNNIGMHFWQTGELNIALDYLNRSMVIREGNDTLLAQTYNNIALINNDLGNIFEAENYYKLSLELREKMKDTVGLATAYNNLGYLFYTQGIKDRSLEYYLKSVEIDEIIDSSLHLANVYNNIGVLLADHDDYKGALPFFRKSLVLYQENKNFHGVAKEKNQMANAYLGLGNLDSSKIFYEQSNSLYEDLDSKRNYSNMLLGYAVLNLKLGNNSLAKRQAEKAIQLNPNEESLSLLKLQSKTLYRVYEANGDYKSGLRYYKKFIEQKDSLESKRFYRQNLYNEKVLVEKMRQDSIALTYESSLVIKDKEIKNISQFRYFLLILLIVSLVATYFIVKNYRQKRKLMQENLEKQDLINKQLEQDLYAKSKRLTNVVLKNEINEQSIVELHSLLDQARKLNSIELAGNLEVLDKQIRGNNLTLRKLEEHEKQVKNISKKFSDSVLEKHPTITERELRISSMIRMGYSSDEICSVMNIAKNTLKSSRYRIHKKMGLEKGMRLSEYLEGFEV